MSATGHRPLSRPGRGPRRARPVHDEGRSRLAQLHQDPQGRRARWRPSPGSSRPVTVAHCGPVLKGEFARTVEHDPMCSRGGPSPARSAGVADKAHHLGPRRRRGRDPVPRAGHGASQAGRNSPATAWCGGPGTRGIYSRPLAPPREERPGHHRDPRSNHVVRRYASLLPPRTPTPSTGCRAACGSRPGTRVNYPGPHPQAHRVGRRQGGQAQAPVRPAPHTPRPAAGHRRPGRRPEGRIDRLPQPAQPRRHHPPHRRAPGRPRPPGQGQDRPAPAPPRSPASCPTSARASGSGEPPRPPPITRAVPREAPKKFRGHLDMRHPACARTRGGLGVPRSPQISSATFQGKTRPRSPEVTGALLSQQLRKMKTPALGLSTTVKSYRASRSYLSQSK